MGSITKINKYSINWIQYYTLTPFRTIMLSIVLIDVTAMHIAVSSFHSYL